MSDVLRLYHLFAQLAPPAGLPKDGNGPEQRLFVGTLVVEKSFELPRREVGHDKKV